MGPMRLYMLVCLFVCLCGSGLASKPCPRHSTFPIKKHGGNFRSNFPTGGVAWGPCVYICLFVCLFVRIRSCIKTMSPSLDLPYKKHGGSFTRSKVGLSRRPTTVHRGLGQPAPTAGCGAPPHYVCRIYFKQYSEL